MKMLDGQAMRNPVHSESIWVYRTNRTRVPDHSGGGSGVGGDRVERRGIALIAVRLLMHDVHTLAQEDSNVLGNNVIQAQRGWCAAAPERSVQAIRYVK